MERVLVLGSGGSGKSTLSVALGARTGLPVVHLDTHYWNPGWTPTPDADWRQKVARLAAEPRWIMDGNFSGTFDARFPRADTVIFLDLPRALCLVRVLRRWVDHAGRTRPDLAPGCPESIDLAFMRWVWSFPERSRPRVMEELAAHQHRCRTVVLRAPVEVERFLGRLP